MIFNQKLKIKQLILDRCLDLEIEILNGAINGVFNPIKGELLKKYRNKLSKL
jgi:hypothetical protein